MSGTKRLEGYVYKIIRCPYCKTLQYVRLEQKSRRCVKCDRRLNLKHVATVALARTGEEASLIVRYLKAKEAGIADKLYKLKE